MFAHGTAKVADLLEPATGELEEKKFDPDQPRVPAGRPGGGRFMSIVGQVFEGASRSMVQERVDRLYGHGFDALFPDDRPIITAPWPSAGRRRDLQDYDKDLIREALLAPPVLGYVDPRSLSATQPNVTREGVDYYYNDDAYQLLGRTYEAGNNAGNRYPVIYIREDGTNLILSGHHRAAAALLKGEPLEAIIIRGPWGPPR